jgi:hypothetical protein
MFRTDATWGEDGYSVRFYLSIPKKSEAQRLRVRQTYPGLSSVS